jgi:leader peptidase (prepilin peptidase)/N-methyltransferase
MCQHGSVIADGLVWAAVGVWAAMGVWVSVTDLRDAIIPRRVCWAGGAVVAALLAIAAGVVGDPLRLVWAAAAAAAVGLFLEVVYRLWPGKIGFGDVRLIIVNSLLAAWWGFPWAWWALCAGALAEWPVAVVSVVRHGRTAQVRWAPGLVAGTAAIVAWRLWAQGPTGIH